MDRSDDRQGNRQPPGRASRGSESEEVPRECGGIGSLKGLRGARPRSDFVGRATSRAKRGRLSVGWRPEARARVERSNAGPTRWNRQPQTQLVCGEAETSHKSEASAWGLSRLRWFIKKA